MKLQNTKSGFTLIELLVVITIIGILATGAVSVFTTQIQKARDTNRITDLDALKGSIEQFYQDTSEYPEGGKDWLTSAATDVQDYLPKLARDPKDHQTCNGGSKCGYAYIVSADSNGILKGAYEVSTALENVGNTTSKAANDGGNDAVRLEFSIGQSTLDTAKAGSASWGATALTVTDASTSIHIGSINSATTTPTITAF